MSFFAPGNGPITSTAGIASNPSTTTILAELDSTNFASSGKARLYTVNCWLGGSTGGLWTLELATSPNVDSTSIVEQTTIWTGSGQTSQFVKKFKVEGSQRIRVRHLSSVTGSFAAKLQAEELA